MPIANITYAGSVSPAIWLSFKGVPPPAGAHAAADDTWLYHVANECVTDWTINANLGSSVVTLQRSVGPGQRRFSDQLNTFLNNPVQTSVLNQIIDAHNAGTLTLHITLKIWYQKFFEKLLSWMTRTEPDTQNIANTSTPDDILQTIKTAPAANGHLKITHLPEEKTLVDIPCMLSGVDEKAATTPGSAPTIKFYIYMKIREELTGNKQVDTIRYFISADYSKIYKFGKDTNPWYNNQTTVTGIEISLKIWESNLHNFIINNTDLVRGRRLHDQIISTCNSKFTTPFSQNNVIMTVRDEIDKYLVTANAWHQPRENASTEKLQFTLSEVFAQICQTRWRASPVFVIRSTEYILQKSRGTSVATITSSDQINLIMQFGAGHCGEHGDVSFSILANIMNNNPSIQSLLVSIIQSGYVNRDHAFLVGGFIPAEIFHVKTYMANNSAYALNDEFYAVDLEKALTDAGGVDGFVCDPYLESTIIGQTSKALLQQLKNYSVVSKQTRFVCYDKIFPVPSSPIPVVDVRSTPQQGI